MFQRLPVGAVAGADLDGVHPVQDVQAGNDHSGKAVQLAAVTGGHGVKPADAAGAPGGRAVFVRLFPQRIAGLTMHFGGHRAAPDTGSTP